MAAKVLLDKAFHRSAVSRAYYAAYAALTGVLEQQGADFTHGGANPSHDQLLALTAHNLDPARYGKGLRRQLKRAAAALQATRINADYNPRGTIDRAIARHMVRQAAFVVSTTAGLQR